MEGRHHRALHSEFEPTLARTPEGSRTGRFREEDLQEAVEEDATGAIWSGSISWAKGRFVWDMPTVISTSIQSSQRLLWDRITAHVTQ